MATVFEVRVEIWEVVEPMIPPVKMPERPGRRPVADRARNAVAEAQAAGAIDWSAAVLDGSHIRALRGGLDRAVSG